MTKFDRLVRAYATTILKFRFVVLALALGLLGVSGYGLSKLDFDTTFRIWHPPESEQLHTYDQRVAKFGGDDTMIVLFKDGKGVLNNRVLSAIRGLTDDIWRIPSVKRVDSLANFQIIRGSRIDHESPALAVTKKHIVAAGDKNDLIAWERPSFTPHALVGHEGLVESVVVSPDGARAYSGSEDRTVRVWDLDLSNSGGAPQAARVSQRPHPLPRRKAPLCWLLQDGPGLGYFHARAGGSLGRS